jgi:zinc transport system substrate-binding protein
MAEALSALLPDKSEAIAQGLQRLDRELDDAHGKLKEALRPYRGGTLMVYHPAFGYFADAYGLKQLAIEIGGKEPTPSQMADVIREAKAQAIRIIFVQKQFSTRAARVVAEAIDGAVLALDPLSADVIGNFERMGESIGNALD